MALATGSGVPDRAWQPRFAVLETSMGDVIIELYWKHAPRTCANFAELTRRGYYNNTKFHRIIRDFMIQGGDPTGTGRGGSSIYGREFPDEIHEDLKHTGAGIISMANSGPNTNGSQFFITLAPTQWLDGKHTIFGRVFSGMAVVKRIGLIETDKDDRPVDEQGPQPYVLKRFVKIKPADANLSNCLNVEKQCLTAEVDENEIFSIRIFPDIHTDDTYKHTCYVTRKSVHEHNLQVILAL